MPYHPNKRWSKAPANKWIRSSIGNQAGPPTAVAAASDSLDDHTTPRSSHQPTTETQPRHKKSHHKQPPILKGPIAAPRMSWKRSHPDNNNNNKARNSRTWVRSETAAETTQEVLLHQQEDKRRNNGTTEHTATRKNDNHTQDNDNGNPWKRIGNHKLVHKTTKEAPTKKRANNALSLDLKKQQQQQHEALNRIGKNKLVAASSFEEEETKQWNASTEKQRNVGAQGQDLRHAKRIRIAATISNEDMPPSTTTTTTETAATRNPNGGKMPAAADAHLTTFAYCQPTTVSLSMAGKHNRTHSVRSLVRVPTNDFTRICPAFARGVVCDKEACLLRHDVPSHASKPACFYFQQDGMCLRERCPFQHVKSLTDPCPRFVQTGYCTQENCMLAHVQHKNKTLHMVNAKHGKDNKKDKDLVFYDDDDDD